MTPVHTTHITNKRRENADADPGSNSVLAEPIANVDDERLEDICLSLQELRNIMVDTFDLPSGWTLEDRLVLYASRLTQLDPTHCFIVDEKMLSALGKRDRKHMLDQVQPLPTFPKVLNSLVDKYKGVTTVPQCREIAGASVDGDELWISRVLEHMLAHLQSYIHWASAETYCLQGGTD